MSRTGCLRRSRVWVKGGRGESASVGRIHTKSINPIFLRMNKRTLICALLGYAFFTMGGDCGHMSSNSVRRVKSVVEKEIGKSFELRDCRRAYGQFYINKGLELEDVSVLMGHGTTKTTELYYCRKRESVVIEKAKDLW